MDDLDKEIDELQGENMEFLDEILRLQDENIKLKESLKKMVENIEEVHTAFTAFMENEGGENSEMLYNQFIEALEKGKATAA